MTGISRELTKRINQKATDKKPSPNNKNGNDLAERFYLELDGAKPGVYFAEDKTSKGDWICSPLEILAETQTETGENYGRLLRWSDSKNRVHSWAMPIEFVHGDGFDLIKYLVSRGLQIGTSRKHYEKLRTYINLSPTTKTIICTNRIGWHGAGFVLPDETIGSDSEIAFQTDAPGFHKFAVRGTLADWQSKVSAFCIGNSRLAFAVATAFACPLLSIVNMQGGGFHFRGETSTGKTTALLVAGSVCGGSDDAHGYCETWRTTSNALEAIAESHNDSLLCLDEIGECDGRQIGEVSYMLAGGKGKSRMAKNGGNRQSYSWELLFLSTGEISLADKMLEAGTITKAGQEIRTADIPADTGKFGLFENLHNFPDGQSFSDYLRTAAKENYGSPLREFLRRFVALDRETIKANWRKFHETFIPRLLPDKNYPSEVCRVASRFALVAYAGEVAAHLGVLNWAKGEAGEATEIVFRAWLENRRGRGGSDSERALSQIRAFIEAHGASRFEMLNASGESLDTGKITNRAGFRKQNAFGELEFLFLPEVFRAEVCKGFDFKFVCKILDERNFLERGSVGFQKQLKYGGVQIRPYWISSKIMSETDESLENKTEAVAGVTK